MQQKHTATVIKTNQFMLFRGEKLLFVLRSIQTTQNVFCGQNVEFFNVKSGCIITNH